MSVTTRHPQYQANQDQWLSLRSAYQGDSAVKAIPYSPRQSRQSATRTRFLPRPSGMRGPNGDAQYLAYVERTTFFGATERTVQGMTGTVFRREPVIEVPTALKPHIADITQTGISLRMFAEQAVRETLLMGRFGVLIDYPHGTLTPEGLLPPALNRAPLLDSVCLREHYQLAHDPAPGRYAALAHCPPGNRECSARPLGEG